MAVFRVERNTGYTVMSNHHLRNKELSLKAKGLLSQMLSLPEDWDYTLSGLSYINRESIDAIRTAVWELEKAGYITRRQGRDEKGKMTAIEYTIYEQPQPPELDCPVLENPTADNPILENPTTDNPTSENPTQLNKDISRTNLPKKEKSNTDLSITHSIPIHSLNPLPYGEDETAQPPERKRTERNDAYRVYTPDELETGETIKTPRGTFYVTDMSREQMEAAGYGFHHQSDDGKYLVMGNGTRAFAIAAEQRENPLKAAEQTTEQNENMIDGIINNTPTVDELEAKVKAGETISLVDLANAVKADKERGKGKPEKKPSIRAQLKADKEKAQKKAAAKTKNHDLEV